MSTRTTPPLRPSSDARRAAAPWPAVRTFVAVGSTAFAFAVAAALAVPVVSALAQTTSPTSAAQMLVYFGTYTGETSKGIYVSRLDLSTGALTPPALAAETPNPSFLAVHPGGAFLYAANEVDAFDAVPGGAVSGFAIERKTGGLTAINRQSSRGGGAVHLVVDKAGRNVLVANYGGGSVAVLPIGADGTLKPASAFVQHVAPKPAGVAPVVPRAHSINLDPANRFAYVPDLGLDQVRAYRFGSDAGSLEAADPPFAALEPGSGPRHFAFHPKGRFAYVISEKHMTVTAFGHDAERGALTPIQTVSTLPAAQAIESGFSTAEVQVHPSGRFLYGSNRGHDSLALFSIDEATGRLTFVETTPTQGNTPRGFGIDPTGTWLLAANQRSDSVVVFRIDRASGRLTPAGHAIGLDAPVCVKFVEWPAR